MIKSLCVYCGSSPGKDPALQEAANAFGRALGAAGLGLVYGGGDRGLMGAVARGALAGGGKVVGVIPRFLMDKERPGDDGSLELTELVVVENMHDRKRIMFERADAFAALPGGIGTLEELVEMMTWAQLDRHRKPIALLNTGGFWDPFMELYIHMKEEGFIHTEERIRPIVSESAERLIEELMAKG